jgi:uncharacterized membrane protein
MILSFWALSLSLLVITLLMRVFPPKGINHLYGYRTPASMRDEVSWKIANDYSSKYSLIIAIGIFILQLLLSFFVGITGMTMAISVLVLAGAMTLMFIMTERQIKKR